MGLFGSSKEDKSQDASIKNLLEWINYLNKNQQALMKNQAVLSKNNTYFIERDKLFATCISELQQKDKQHDKTDVDLQATVKSIKNMAKAIEQTEGS